MRANFDRPLNMQYSDNVGESQGISRRSYDNISLVFEIACDNDKKKFIYLFLSSKCEVKSTP